tara:strand:+ start:285 stop:1010 length:726 start_codon:yes stop_codon:yes gene_type:complete
MSAPAPAETSAEASAKASAEASAKGFVQVTVDPSGRVGLNTREPMTLAHVHSDEPSLPAVVHCSGSTAGISFTDRAKGLAWDAGGPGDRWELLSESKTAKLRTPATGDVARFAQNGAVTIPGSLTCASLEQTSSRELKSAVRPLAERLDAEALLEQLRPVSFRFRRDGEAGPEHAGFIAEELPASLAGEEQRSVRLSDLVAVLTQCVKSQAETIRRHESDIGDLRRAMAEQAEALAQLQRS